MYNGDRFVFIWLFSKTGKSTENKQGHSSFQKSLWSIATVLPTVVALRAHTRQPLWIKPSAGLPELVDGHAVHAQTPEDFAEPVHTLLDAGANVIGGCCGAGPDHIKRVNALVGSWKKKRGQSSID